MYSSASGAAYWQNRVFDLDRDLKITKGELERVAQRTGGFRAGVALGGDLSVNTQPTNSRIIGSFGAISRSIPPASSSSSSQGSSSSAQSSGGVPPALLAAIVGVLDRVASAIEPLESVSPGQWLRRAVEEDPMAVGEGMEEATNRDRGLTTRILTKQGFS